MRFAKFAPSKYDSVDRTRSVGAAVDLEVPRDLLVGVAVGETDRALEVAEERDVGHDRDEVVDQSADCERDTAALAAHPLPRRAPDRPARASGRRRPRARRR